MPEQSTLPQDETDNTTVEATLNITTRSDCEDAERANNRKLSTVCGLSRQSFAYRVCAAIIAALLLVLIGVLKPNESAAVRDLSDLLLQFALNLTRHGADGH